MLNRLIAIVLCSLLAMPAMAKSLGVISITTAVTAQVTAAVQVGRGYNPPSLTVQCRFTYGSGGTSADAWVQTSIDGGTTWTDIANCHFTTSSARFVYNLSAMTPVATQYTPLDGTLSANTSKDGLLGPMFRVKYTTVGTYAGSTSMAIDINGAQFNN